jgi:hypothetical protein
MALTEFQRDICRLIAANPTTFHPGRIRGAWPEFVGAAIH